MIKSLEYRKENYRDLFEYTEAEREAINSITNINYKIINSLLAGDDGQYEKRNSMETNFISANEENKSSYLSGIMRTIEEIPLIYSAMIKSGIANGNTNRNLYRGTSMQEIRTLEEDGIINHCIASTAEKNSIGWQGFMYNENQDAPVSARIFCNNGVQVIDVSDILGDDIKSGEAETIIAPFTKVKKVVHERTKESYHGTRYEEYRIVLEPSELVQLSTEERETLLKEIMDAAPQIHEYLAAIIRESKVRDDIEFKKRQKDTNISKLLKEKKEYEKEIESNSIFLAEREVEDLIKLWENYINDPQGFEYRENQYGITSFGGNIESQFYERIRERVRFLQDGLEKRTSINGQSYDAFYRLERSYGISSVEMFEKFLAEIGRASFDSKEDKNSLLRVLRRMSQYLNEHLDMCNIGSTEQLQEKEEKYYRKIDGVDKDIKLLNKEIKELDVELDTYRKQVAEYKPIVKDWKEKIARLCQSDCKTVELDMEQKIKEREAQIRIVEEERAQQAKQEQEAKKRHEAKLKRISDLQRNVREKFTCESHEFDGFFEDRLIRSKRLAADIQRVSGYLYFSKISEYQNVMDRTKSSINRLAELGNLESNTDIVIGALERIDGSPITMNNYGVINEIKETIMVEENLLKKVVFEKFSEIAIHAEISSLGREAESLSKKNSRKGVASIFNKKDEFERASKIEKFIADVTQDEHKDFKDKQYSYRNIMAEMNFFIEQHAQDPEYSGAIKEIEKLRIIISSHFRASDPNSISNMKDKKAQEQSNLGIDPRVYRIINLKRQMEKNGLYYRIPSKEMLNTINDLNSVIVEQTDKIIAREQQPSVTQNQGPSL